MLLAVVATVLLAGCGSGRSSLVSIGAGLRGPEGLKATVYARGLGQASAFAFDRRGRLWVTTSGATDHSADALYLVPKHGAVPVKVAAGLKGPLGLTWDGDTLYVASIGRVDAFSGLHGTRFSKRAKILDGPVAGASNNGIVVSPSGRLVMSVSTTCDHCTPVSRLAATIVSFRRDGSDLRVVARGVRAGYGLAYYPQTSDLFVTMNQRDDLGARTPGDWLALVRPGENWGFPGCYGQGGAVCHGVPGPVAVLDKHAAASGVAFLDGSAIVAEWATGEVKRVSLTGSAASYSGEARTFLTGLKNPLAVAAAPDGAVLVGDWTSGTVYEVAPA